MLRRAFIAFSVVAGFASPALAGPLEDGVAAYKKRDWEKSMKLLKPLADEGNAVAQEHVGRIYRTGFFNGRADFGNALKYYRLAAAKNVAVAQLGLGSMYKAGEGVTESEAEAVVWFRKAADQGDAAAQMNLAAMYRYGKGVPKDIKEAQRLLKLAAAGTDPEYDEDVFVRAKRELEQIASDAGTGRL